MTCRSLHLALPALRVLALAALAAALGGCSNGPRLPQPVSPGPVKPVFKAEDWTAAKITENPTGYIQWADSELARQIAERKQRLVKIEQQVKEVADKGTKFTENVAEIRNLHQRIAKAYQRAEDEDRWPLMVAGGTFDRRTAKAIIEKTKQYVDERQPLEAAYEQANTRLATAVTELGQEIDDLGRLRERLALDLERIQLNQGIEELDQLRKTESDIASYAKALRENEKSSVDVISALNDKAPPPPVNVDAFLSPK